MPNTQLPLKKTKIVCTIGPASESQEMLERLIEKGMNIARLNFAHGDFKSHRQTIKHIRSAAKTTGRRVAIFGDLPGPKMRVGRVANDSVQLKQGQTFILQADDIVGDEHRVSINFKDLSKVVKPGDTIFINDGFLGLEVENVQGQEVHCTVQVGGELRSQKGVNFPGIDLGISAFTEQDREFLQFAAEQQLDGVSQSFVQNAEDITIVRETAAAINYHPFIIAKIERSRAVENLDEILKVTDAIMVARGDLGVEIPIENVAIVQKHIITQCNLARKPVITATHMLESMITHSRPTRAEATDVANAIIDGTDCVMLSGETAMGDYPVESVNTMSHIAQATETNIESPVIPKLLELEKVRGEIALKDLISFSTYLTIETLKPTVIFTPTISGATARRLTRFRLPMWIVALTPNKVTAQQLQFSFGVHPVYKPDRPASWQTYARNWMDQRNISCELAMITRGPSSSNMTGTYQVEIIDLTALPAEEAIW